MKQVYYILTTASEMMYYERFRDALAEFKRLYECEEHLRLERADDEQGTARVIRSKNNIW